MPAGEDPATASATIVAPKAVAASMSSATDRLRREFVRMDFFLPDPGLTLMSRTRRQSRFNPGHVTQVTPDSLPAQGHRPGAGTTVLTPQASRASVRQHSQADRASDAARRSIGATAPAAGSPRPPPPACRLFRPLTPTRHDPIQRAPQFTMNLRAHHKASVRMLPSTKVVPGLQFLLIPLATTHLPRPYIPPILTVTNHQCSAAPRRPDLY
jgi:hypothetical protein